MNATILQISDLHPGKASIDGTFESTLERMIKDLIVPKLSSRLIATEDKSVKDEQVFLVLNGDFVCAKTAASHSPNSKGGHEMQFKLSYRVLVELLKSECKSNGIEFNLCVAVPGNHDITRQNDSQASIILSSERGGDIGIIPGKDRAEPFNRVFSDGRFVTPRDVNDERFFEKATSKQIVFWPIDSSTRCGYRYECTFLQRAGKAAKLLAGISHMRPMSQPPAIFRPKLDLIEVEREHIRKISEGIGALPNSHIFPIAVVHHSPFRTANRFEPHLYSQQGMFQDCLLRNNFKLLLHGHNHESTIWHFSHPKKMETTNIPDVRPYIESGIICIGAPSLWPDNEQAEKGFNIIRLRSEEGTSIVKVTLFKNVFSKTEFGPRGKEPELIETAANLRVSTTPIESFPDPHDRMKAIEVFSRYAYSDVPVEEFDRSFISDTNARERLESINRCYFEYSKIDSLREVIFQSPGSWRNSGYMISSVPHVNQYLRRSHSFLKSNSIGDSITHGDVDSRQSRINDAFSKEIHDAMVTCLNRSRDLKPGFEVGSVLSKNPEVGRYMSILLDSLYRRKDQESKNSLSVWGEFEQESLERQRNTEHQIKGMCFARILVWPSNWLRRESALEIIRFHEDNYIPLFWLSPDEVTDSDSEDEENFDIREEVGYLHITGVKKHKKSENKSEAIFLIDKFGKKPDRNMSSGGDHDATSRIWSIKSDDLLNTQVSPRCQSIEDDFSFLLERPSLLFAADAWYIANSGIPIKLD